MPTGRRPTVSTAVLRQAGFTYLGVLFIVALLGLSLAAAGQIWSVSAKRAKESELLWAGNQYARAIRSYFRSSPGAKAYPRALADLLVDNRFPQAVHHLRQPYRDPLSPNGEWGLIKNARGEIVGVHSTAEGDPLRRANFPLAWPEFENAQSYADWRFVADPALRSNQILPPVNAPVRR